MPDSNPTNASSKFAEEYAASQARLAAADRAVNRAAESYAASVRKVNSGFASTRMTLSGAKPAIAIIGAVAIGGACLAMIDRARNAKLVKPETWVERISLPTVNGSLTR